MTPFVLQFTLWYHFTLLTGMCRRNGYRSMRFKYIALKKDAAGLEYLELLEWNSKTWDDSFAHDGHATSQKVFCICDGDRNHCVFVSQRPGEMFEADSPLYLQNKADKLVAKEDCTIWFKKQPMGHNMLGKLLPSACKLAFISIIGNQGVQASMVQCLRKAEVPDDQIILITGHHSVHRLAIYNTDQLSSNTHKKFQCILQLPKMAGKWQ